MRVLKVLGRLLSPWRVLDEAAAVDRLDSWKVPV